jgi:hypothetical protein
MLSDWLTATPFPRKSRHRSDVKRLPQSASQLQSKSLTRLTTLLPFYSVQDLAMVVPASLNASNFIRRDDFIKEIALLPHTTRKPCAQLAVT